MAYSSDDARRDLDAIVDKALGVPHDLVHRRIVCGVPATELIAASQRAELLVIGARGMGGFKGLLLGSVSREVLYGAQCPVAVVRRGPVDDGPIVVGVDGSKPSRQALSWAVAEAAARHTHVVAVHAWRFMYAGDGYLAPHLDPASMCNSAEMLLAREVDAHTRSGVRIEPLLVQDLPSAALLEASETASMLVVGTGGHRRLVGLLLGSVSDQVAHHAGTAVVVVPGATSATALVTTRSKTAITAARRRRSQSWSTLPPRPDEPRRFDRTDPCPRRHRRRASDTTGHSALHRSSTCRCMLSTWNPTPNPTTWMTSIPMWSAIRWQCGVLWCARCGT